ncbi:DUF4232 domain-containing protein [Umezawaea beigongshangensis]|uniref:DUF4232 domain-containing protein n=1 Tax=Umezawaea beigongshangensis TaxID=2780383 RepID=UPI0018F190E7|nr:DUF4232 domain-containing protein [Umezawaea beigongshangensis]
MSANSNWIRRSAAAVVALAAVGALSACSDGQTENASSGTDAQEAVTGGREAVSGGQEPDALTSGGGNGAACTNVKASLGSTTPSSGGSQMRVQLVFVNQGARACVLRGFPGVQLRSADGTTWDLRRSSEEVESVTLAPGGGTSAALTTSSADNATGWHVSTVLVTPPNTTSTTEFNWTHGPVHLQKDATRPATFVGPVG